MSGQTFQQYLDDKLAEYVEEDQTRRRSPCWEHV
uniref:Uncharacterized protein n=1 Tax=Mycolicibacterium sp. CBMA 213 TaxID=1968788 RepID=A0A343VRF4_9MYCO|nr:hypothetical protein B5P44_p00183 [Mycolicibacterium sp. CBMA 213]